MSRRIVLAWLFGIASVGAIAFVVATRCVEPYCRVPQPERVERGLATSDRRAPSAPLERDARDERAAPTSSSTTRSNAVVAPPDEPGVSVSAEEGVLVRVVLASTGAPVSGARVRGLGLLERRDEPDARKPLPVGVLDPEAELGDTPFYVTNERGETRVPKRSLPADYSAGAGALWGKAYCSDGETPPFTIALEPDASFRVRVVDAHGQPAARREVAFGCASAPREELWSALTDDAGFVTVRHVAAAALKCLDPEEVVVRPVLLARDDAVPALFVDPRASASSTLELALPPLGRVEVAVRARDGRPLDAASVVLTRPEDLASWGAPKTDASVWRPERVEPGLAVFEDVGLGLDVCACASDLAPERVHVVGRSAETMDGVARIELVVDAPWPVLTGRLLDAAGRPLGDVDAAWRAPAGGGCVWYVGAEPFRTDAEGRFRVLHRGAREVGEVYAREVRVEWLDRDGVRHHLRPALPSKLHDGENGLGDLRFARTRVVARGVVVDAAGTTPSSDDWSAWFAPSEEPSSMQVAEFDLHRSPGGTFEVFAESPSQRWRVHARAPGFEESEPLEFDAGAADVRVVLGAGGSIRGRLVLEPGVASERIGVHVLRTDGGEHGPVYLPIAEDGSFRFGASRSGTFTLVVEHAAWGTLVELAGLVLEGDGDCTDPRVASIRVAAPGPR